MTQLILKSNGNEVPRRTVTKLSAIQLAPSNEVEKKKRDEFDKAIKSLLGYSMSLTPIDIDPSKLEDNDDFVEDMFNPSPYNAAEAPSRMPQADCVNHNGVPVLAQPETDVCV